ncbi:small-subunit processome [Lipomyces orientalis]|uniref:Small-subunit processome n=1 Tax=Lipomyces orientalis TaxID=1233043 RepID=A0ACC3TMG5_9ASCO
MAKLGKLKAKQPDIAAKKKLEEALRQVDDDEMSPSDSDDSFLAGDHDKDGGDESDGEGSAALDDVDQFGILKSAGNSPDGTDDDGDVADHDSESADETPSFSGTSDIDGSAQGITTPLSDIESDSPSLEENDDNAIRSLQKAIDDASRKPEEQTIKIKKRKKLGLPTHFTPTVDEDDGTFVPAKKKVTLDDIRAHTTSSFGTRSLARLDELEKRSKGKSEVVKSRLGRRLEARIDRAAAYEIAKAEVGKWEDTVKKNREAEHLEFPLQHSGGVETSDITNSVDADAEAYGEKLVYVLEDREFSLDEVLARRNELRRMRELMFREEMRAKRVKKIKSKTYRKIHKREKERAQEIAAQLDGEPEGEDEEDYDRLVKRARERMELRHKNTSKWARDVKRMNLHKDRGTREELEEMLRRGEDLTRKIEGDDEISDGDDDDALPSVLDGEEEAEKPNGIMAMKFMKEAEERLRKQTKEAFEELRRMEGGHDEMEEQVTDSAVKIINEGRRQYAPGGQEAKEAAGDAVEESNEADFAPGPLGRKMATIVVENGGILSATSIRQKSNRTESKKVEPKSAEASNPWIQDVEPGSVTKVHSVLSLSKDSTRDAKAEARLKRARKNAEKAANAVANGDADVKINVNQILQVRDVHDDGDTGADGFADSQLTMVYKGARRAKPAEFQQRELVKRAFAGDDVVREFEAEKKRTIEDEGDKEIDVTLPGWGSWTGKGVRKPQKKFVQKIEGIVPKNRKDSKLKNVIINEKAAKKSAKYTAGTVPFPYETREQYERSLRMPIGKQWATQTTVQRLTKPKVIVKPGAVVEPLSAPFAT